MKLRVLAAITERPNAEGAIVVKSGLTQEDQSPCLVVDLLKRLVRDLASAKSSPHSRRRMKEQKEKRKADAEAAREAKKLKKEVDAQHRLCFGLHVMLSSCFLCGPPMVCCVFA